MTLALPLDHVVALCADLPAAGAAFADAGFRVTPLAHHSAQMGTANICVMLADSYIELMGIVAETPANATWRAMLAAGGGLRGLALRSEDIAASAAALTAAGIGHEPVRAFSRATEAGELRFSVIRLAPEATPGLQCLCCQHHSRALLWRPEHLAHPNGAGRIAAVQLPDPAPLVPLAALPGPGRVPLRAGAPAVAISLPRPLPAKAEAAILRLAGLQVIPC
ncbi:VOC family protein [Paracoccus limosus]|uniref:VOC family protein n=1 Tax=Paracoccus limosus TaxID=913252 RepID=A0A844H2F7_9RHOB|nr:VOC family protein [Paracoccus limosus]MTH33744.1 VOC family protein [Paracoccus limosus]